MLGLSILAVIFGYIFLSKFIVTKVYKSYGVKKANIALAIMILIPTWDVILGFPVYAYLCFFEAGPKIYKTVDNVEGFYVGEQDIRHQPYEPYEGYKYIDYKETAFGKPTEKYYRSYWVDYYKDKNTSNLCVSPRHPNYSSDPYTKAFNEGKCIVKKEIAGGEISRWEEKFKKELIYEIPILRFKIFRKMQYLDNKTKEIMAIGNGVWWQGGWLYGIFSSIEVGSGGTSCNGDLDYTKLEKEVLKPKKQEKK